MATSATEQDVEVAAVEDAAPAPTHHRRRTSNFSAITDLDMITTEVASEREEPTDDPVASTNIPFWYRISHADPDDPTFDFKELGPSKEFHPTKNQEILLERSKFNIATLKECQRQLHNKETDAYNERRQTYPGVMLLDRFLDVIAAFYVFFAGMMGIEGVLVITNAALATWFYVRDYEKYSIKLDFAFLAFSVVFPLTFLIQSTFSRRDQALGFFADFKASVLACALLELTTDWPAMNGKSGPIGGRLDLPRHFNKMVVDDTRDLLQLVYEYLSMPSVMHARNLVFPFKQNSVIRVHARQNHISKKLNESMLDLAMHTEEMRKYGFPSGEASRLHQYHQYIQHRWEKLRIIKYYRTPQATRSYGRVYLFILPWICGPYFAWVYEDMNLLTEAYTIILACFTYLILLGLMNATIRLEDPFFVDQNRYSGLGVDSIKLDFEMASIVQAVEQFYANAELQRSWKMGQKLKAKAEQKRAHSDKAV